MGDIIQFPAFDERSWREMEAVIKEALLSAGAPPDAVAWVSNDLKARFLASGAQSSQSFTTSGQCAQEVSEAVNVCVKMMHDSTSALLFQMVLLELELYFEKHPRDGAPAA